MSSIYIYIYFLSLFLQPGPNSAIFSGALAWYHCCENWHCTPGVGGGNDPRYIRPMHSYNMSEDTLRGGSVVSYVFVLLLLKFGELMNK